MATMNGVRRTGQRVGLAGTTPPAGTGMMGTTPEGRSMAGYVPPANGPSGRGPVAQVPYGGMAANAPRGPGDGVRMPMPQQQLPMPAQPQFDPNDPRNAALAGYMNRG